MPLDGDLSVSSDPKQPITALSKSGLGSAISSTIEKELPGALQQSKDLSAAQQAAAGETVRQLDTDREKRGTLQAPLPPAPKPPPEYPQRSPSDAWGSIAMVAAGLLAGRTRRALTNSLNAAAGVMQAYQKGDTEQYKRDFERWKAESEYGGKMYEYQRDAYKDAIATIDSDQQGAIAKLKVVSAALGDDPMHRLAQAGNVAGVLSLEQQRTVAMDHTSQQSEKLKREGEAVGELMAARKAVNELPQNADPTIRAAAQARLQSAGQAIKDLHAGTGTAGGWQVVNDPTNRDAQGNPIQYRYNPGTGEATDLSGSTPYAPGGQSKLGAKHEQPSDPATIESVAKGIAEYRLAPLGAWAMRSEYGQKVMARVQELNPEYQSANFAARVAATRAFTVGKQADAVRSFSVSIDHLATVDELGRALQNNDVQAINRLKNTIATQFGHEGPVDFNWAKSIVGTEVSKAILGGIGALVDRQELQKGFDVANSPEQLRGVIQTAKKLMAGQLAGYERQYQRGTGQPDFEALLSPEAKRQLTGLRRDDKGTGAQKKYATADDVLKDIDSGQLTADQGRKIIIDQFGYKAE